MVHEPELEEGKTCYSKDDASFDPDIDLSYIGDKVQSILGHFQKDFEGGVSAENLGAKFGGYGSFLPMYQRSPSNMLQPKSPQKTQNMRLRKSTNHLSAEAPASNSIPVAGAPSLNAHPKNLKDVLIRDKAGDSSDKIGGSFSRKMELPSQCPDKGTLKFRIKVGPERIAKYKAEMLNLGLTSPSSSEGDDGIDGLKCKFHGSPRESPAEILQMMTSTHIVDGFLLSPLCEDLLNLNKEKDILVKVASEATPRSSDLPFQIPSNEFIKRKSKPVKKVKNIEESDCRNMVDISNFQEKYVKTDLANMKTPDNLSFKPSPDRDSKVTKSKGSQNAAKNQETSKDVYLEHDSLHISDAYDQPESRNISVEKISRINKKATTSHKDVSADDRPLHRSGGNRDFSQRETPENNHKFGMSVPSVEYSDPGLSQGADQLPTEGNKKFGTQVVKKTTPKSADASKGNSCAASKIENIKKKEPNPREDLTGKSLGCEKLTDFPESSNLDKPKKSYLNDAVKKKPSSTVETKETTSTKKNLDKLRCEVPKLKAHQALAVPYEEGSSAGLSQPVAYLQDNWVGCDRCQKWRLLPFGTKPEQLPDKWVCSMLDWLPGMNRCDIGEDETTKALYALYQLPFPGDQCKALEETTTGFFPVHHLDQGGQNRILDQNAGLVKKTKLKKKPKPPLNDPLLNGNKLMQQQPLMKGHLDEVNASVTNAVNDSYMHHQNKPSTVGAKLKKRKGDHVTRDEEGQRNKMKKVSSQHVEGEEANISSPSSLAAVQINTNGSLKSGVPGGSALKNENKNKVQKAAMPKGIGSIETHMEIKKHPIQTLPKNRPLSKAGDEKDLTVKKIKLKDYGDSKPEYKVSERGDNEGSGRVRATKSQASLDGKVEISRAQGDVMLIANCVEGGVRLIKSKDPPSGRSVNGHEKKPAARMQITKEDIDKIRKDLGYEEVPVAATSNSSKVSGSRKKRSHTEMMGSPAESVSSSPVRLSSYPNQVPRVRGEAVNGRHRVLSETKSVKKHSNRDECSASLIAREEEAAYGDRPGSSGNNVLDFRESDARNNSFDEQCIHEDHPGTKLRQPNCKKNPSLPSKDSNVRHLRGDCKGETHGDAKGVRVKKIMRVDLHQGDARGSLDPEKNALGSLKFSKTCNEESVPVDTSGTSRAVKGKTIISPMNVPRGNSSSALKEAEFVLKEAEKLKTHAELIKGSGFIIESNYEFLKAAVKYLQGASLLDACGAEGCKSLEVNPMQMYAAAAKLCKTCAPEYEKSNEMAAAALAYKCMEVAYLRMVYCKSSNTSRLWQDLQTSMQMNPQGESPSSSASDVDNLNNNLAAADKALLSKGIVSRPGNNVVAPRNRQDLVRLLDFTRDTNSAMEAAKKSRDAFSAAQRGIKGSQNTEAIDYLKEVINFGFLDVQELIRLIWVALNAINNQVLGSHGE